MNKSRLAIISTHPIQYNAPWFALLAKQENVEIKVFYTWSQRQSDLFDENFGKEVKWDIPLLKGYDYEFIDNTSKDPGNKHFKGVVCPTLIKSIEAFMATHVLFFGWNFKAHYKAMRYFKDKVPVLFRGDSTLLDETSGLKQTLRRMVLRWVYKSVDIALYVGKANKAYFLKHGLKENQLVYAPHAIDNERFKAKENSHYTKEAQLMRKEMMIGENDFVFLFVGKFEPKKDPLLLLQAYNNLISENQTAANIKLIYVGSGFLEKNLRELSDKSQGVHFIPFQNQSQMPIIYRLGNVLCLPSKGPGETWGLAVNEAMASGLPCIVSDKVGCAEDLGRYRGNLVFEAGNIDALGQSMKMMLSNDAALMDQANFLSDWNFKKIVKATCEIMQEND